MGNTVKGLQDEFNEIIGRVRGFKVKAASPEKQKAFNLLNIMQGHKYYFLAIKIVQTKLLNGLK